MKNLKVCMVTEGTYPYVVGGVSSWTHRLITQLKDIEFDILAIVPEGELKQRYKLPPNVGKVYTIPIVDEEKFKQPKMRNSQYYEKFIKNTEWLHENIREDNYDEAAEYLIKLNELLEDTPVKFWSSKNGWNYLKQEYKKRKEKPPMIEWILSWKDTHIPLLNLLSAKIPQADIYHGTNSGFAGFLAVLGALKYNKPSVLTDHGIFLREKLMELTRAKVKGLAEDMWLNVLTGLSRLIYLKTTLITAVCKYNVKWVKEKLRINEPKFKVIYNGINTDRITPVDIPKPPYKVVGTIARVHPIKDIKLFIKAAEIVLKEESNTKFFVVGPIDDKKYYKECLNLIKKLGLSENFIFTGTRGEDIVYWYNLFDIFVLSSISEGFPLSTIEAMATGTPVVVTDVGGAGEPVKGCGYVVPSGDVKQFAEKILKILKDDKLAQKLSKNARNKALKQFSLPNLMREYEKVYYELSTKEKI
ncbi:MAG: GT4 family glycosyltransferase PelF [Candidatus Odinarchaeia archaeon]